MREPTATFEEISRGAHELLTVLLRSLEKTAAAKDDCSYASAERGVLRALLRAGVPHDGDCRVLASVLADAANVSNCPDQT